MKPTPKAECSAEAAFSAIDRKLWTPGSGCSGALDYMEQSSWLLFLRYLDAREHERRLEASLTDHVYEPALPKKLRWSTWAYPVKADGSFDYDAALKGDELIWFVQHTLFPGLRRLKEEARATDSIQYRIGAIFEQLNCRFTDGYLLREVIQLMQPLRFQTEADRHEMSVAYESRLGEMGNAGRDGGQYYTPRPLIRVMIRLLDPQVGERFDDGACGSGGFLCEAYRHMREKARNDPKAYDVLQHRTFTGGEVKPLAYVTAQMNCILHGLESPNIAFGDTLANKIADFTDRDRVDVIGANPPFGAGANRLNQQNFTVTTSETALMFMEYFMAKLLRGGRAAVIIKNTFLSNTDAASVALRRMLLARCRLKWVLDLPQKVFTAGVHTVVLFFTKDGPTAKPINYYQLDLKGVSLGKTRPLREADLAEFESLVKKSRFPRDGELKASECPAHWQIDPNTVDEATADLSVKNPNVAEEKLPSAAECRAAVKAALAEIAAVVKEWGEPGKPEGGERP
ncbi:MAG: SAM-dependent DNA methyltransferase [Kiritimatiellae bacterium]|nr:SAM-dependent DNA methyltransferase [Kiritimatiellia bacterium]